jgi:hypothetical protein
MALRVSRRASRVCAGSRHINVYDVIVGVADQTRREAGSRARRWQADSFHFATRACLHAHKHKPRPHCQQWARTLEVYRLADMRAQARYQASCEESTKLCDAWKLSRYGNKLQGTYERRWERLKVDKLERDREQPNEPVCDAIAIPPAAQHHAHAHTKQSHSQASPFRLVFCLS